MLWGSFSALVKSLSDYFTLSSMPAKSNIYIYFSHLYNECISSYSDLQLFTVGDRLTDNVSTWSHLRRVLRSDLCDDDV